MKRLLVLLFPALLIVGQTAGDDPTPREKEKQIYRAACDAYADGLYEIAFRDLMSFAARGDAWSQFAVAEMLRTGNGTRRDREEALVWYRRAAEQDYAPAQCNLGTALYNGSGAPADPQAAIDWWLNAALNRNAYATFNLGTVIAKGCTSSGTTPAPIAGCQRDYARAYRWMKESSALGYRDADAVLDDLRTVMTPAQVSWAERMSLHDAMDFERRRTTRPPG